MTTKQYLPIALVLFATVVISFSSGFLTKTLLVKSVGPDERNLIPYFRDEIIIITKEKPHYTLIASATRKPGSDKSYFQRQKAFYFDGEVWLRESSTIDAESLEISYTPTIPKWEINYDPTFVLKQSVGGEVLINNQNIRFEAPLLNNELGVRSLAGYTEFRSEGDGTLIIGNKRYESHVLYTRIYSYNASIDLIEVTDPLGINTDWVAFWDSEGNFYNIDKTTVDSNYKGPYKFHSIAILKDNEERVQKSFALDVQKKSEQNYQIVMPEKISKTLNVNLLNSVSKESTTLGGGWITGTLEGEVRTKDGKVVSGFGVYEQIYQ